MRNYASPVFQHRHYALIASVLAQMSERDNPTAIKAALAVLFKRDNPQFDWDRFMSAANGEPNGRDKR
jgi:hypothetical protein